MIKMQPLVSVCVQTYQQAEYIRQCLDGILMQQTDFSFEIILGEDESSDGTREICIEYAEKHPDIIRLFLRSRKDVIYINGNPTGRYNMIENLKEAKGKYIALCEGDDYWTDPLKLQKQVDFLEKNSNYYIVFTNGKWLNDDFTTHFIYEDSRKDHNNYRTYLTPNETTDVKTLAKGNYIHTPGVVFRNIFYNKPLPDYMKEVTIGDWPLYMAIVGNKSIKYISDDTFRYRINSNGVYSKKSSLDKIKMTMGQFAPMVNEQYFNNEIENIIWDYCYKTSVKYLHECNGAECEIFFIDFLQSFKNINQFYYQKIIKDFPHVNKLNENIISSNTCDYTQRIEKKIKKLLYKLFK